MAAVRSLEPARSASRTLETGSITGYTTREMKTAISIPDALFHEIESCSRHLRISRSRLFADAAREYLARHHGPADATAAWNRVIAKAGQPGDEPAAIAARKRSKAVIRKSLAKSR
jgi:metal-responsive CopG/Arc/MetJ family transcriptional regulator